MRSNSNLDSASTTSYTSQPGDYLPQNILQDLRYHSTFVDIEDLMHSVLLIPKDWRVTYGAIIGSVLADAGFSASLKKYRWLSTIGNTTEADHASLNNHALSALDSVEPVIGSDNTPWEMKYVFCALDTTSNRRIKDSNDPFTTHQRPREDEMGDKKGPRKIRSEETTSRKRKSAWGNPPAKRQKVDSAPARVYLSFVYVNDDEEVDPAPLKTSQIVRASMLKIAHGLLEKFSASPLRSHVTLGLVDRDRFQLLHANRSTVTRYQSQRRPRRRDVHCHPHRSTQTESTSAWRHEYRQRFLSDSISHVDNIMILRANVPGKTPIVITLGRVLSRETYIIGRSTTTLCGTSNEWPGMNLVVKIGFPDVKRGSEETFIRKATEKAHGFSKEGEPRYWVLDHLPQLLYAETADLNEIEENVKVLCTQGDYVRGEKPLYDDRHRRILVYEMLYPLDTLSTARDVVQVFVDITATHKWLYDHPRILHGDISMSNIMYRKSPDGTIYGVLIDFDLSSFRDALGKVTSFQRTGTAPFMAIDVLKGLQDYYYRHDLESIFYVMLTIGCLYDLRPPKPSSPSDQSLRQCLFFRYTHNDEDFGIASWFHPNTSYETMAIRKNALFYWVNKPVHKLTPSFECLRPWLVHIQRAFFRGHLARLSHTVKVDDYEEYLSEILEPPMSDTWWIPGDDEPRPVQDTPPPPFDSVTLGGHVTFEYFIAWAFRLGDTLHLSISLPGRFALGRALRIYDIGTSNPRDS